MNTAQIESTLARLRVELFTCTQRLEGGHLENFWKLIDDINAIRGKAEEPKTTTNLDDIRTKLLEHASLALSCRKYGDAVMLLDTHSRLSFGRVPIGIESGEAIRNANDVPSTDPGGG